MWVLGPGRVVAAKLFALMHMTLIMRETGTGGPRSVEPQRVRLLAGVFVHGPRFGVGLGGGAPWNEHALSEAVPL
jgi:hypothetical protein